MNNELVKQEIANIISDKVDAAWRQYPAGVAQKKELTELGIIDLMPEGFAFTDAKVVLEALDEKTISGFDADGEGFADTSESTLKALIEATDESQATDETDYDENTEYFYSDEQQAIEDEVDELIEAATVEESDNRLATDNSLSNVRVETSQETVWADLEKYMTTHGLTHDDVNVVIYTSKHHSAGVTPAWSEKSAMHAMLPELKVFSSELAKRREEIPARHFCHIGDSLSRLSISAFELRKR